jgi:hypothetical protein
MRTVEQKHAYLLASGEGFRYQGDAYYGFADRVGLPKGVRAQVRRWAKRLEAVKKDPLLVLRGGEVVMGEGIWEALEQAIAAAKAEAAIVPPACRHCGGALIVGRMGGGEIKYHCENAQTGDKDFLEHMDASTWYAPQLKQRQARYLVYEHAEALVAAAREGKERRESLELVLAADDEERQRRGREMTRLRGALEGLGAEIEAAQDLGVISYNVAPEIKGLFLNWRSKIKTALGEA